MIALYPGAFKPPHRGHFEVVQRLLKGNHGGHLYTKETGAESGAKALSGEKSKIEKINKVYVFPGGGERNGITKEQTLAIWKIYAKHLPGVEILDGQKNPMFAAKDYAKEHPEEQFYAVTGVRDESDFADLNRITTFTNTPNVQGLVIGSDASSGIRATDLRASILSGNLDQIQDFFPKELTREEILHIVKMLKDIIIAEELGNNIEAIFEAWFPKNEGSSGAPIAPQSAERSVDRHMRQEASEITKYIASILEYMLDQKMNILPLPEVKIVRDENNAADFFGKTAYYDPNKKEIVLYVEGRHNKDICRSFAHEMIHHIQNLENRLGSITTSNTNQDDNLLELEKEAYLLGNITFRNWEDSIKNQPKEEVVKEDSKYDEYEELASELAESLVRMFQSKGEKEFNHSMTVKREIEGRPFEFDLEVILGFDSKVKEFEGQGYAYAGEEEDEDEDEEYFYMEEDSITIHIVVNPNLERKYEVMELGLMHFLVHEMEHLVHGEGLNRIDSKFVYEDPFFRTLIDSGEYGDGEEATAEYKILPREVAAGVKELAARAKATGNSFDEEVEEELDKSGITTPKYRRKVKLAYRKYIGKNELDLELKV